jgi:serine/threonine-protein kinase RsbW
MAQLASAHPLVDVVLPATPTSVRTARAAAGDAAADVAVEERIVDDIRLCVSEAVTNSVRHAYGPDGGTVQVVVTHVEGELVVVVCDHGAGFGSSSRRRDGPGGLGLEIIDALTSRHHIASSPNQGTEVRMTFSVGPKAPLV